MSELPRPFTPAEVDLHDYSFMPLDVERLRRSRAWRSIAKKQPEIGFYMINLWCASWHERPAASLEDDDELLADLAMCSPRRWPAVRKIVLYGWVKCSDGRLYHPVVSEKALEAWEKRRKASRRGKLGADARWGYTIDIPNVENGTSNGTGMLTPSSKDAYANAKAMLKNGKREEKDIETPDSPNGESEAPLAPVEGLNIREELFGRCLRWLAQRNGKDPDKCRSIVGGWIRDYGDGTVLEIFEKAMRYGPVAPIPWIAKALKRQSEGQSRHTDKGNYGFELNQPDYTPVFDNEEDIRARSA